MLFEVRPQPQPHRATRAMVALWIHPWMPTSAFPWEPRTLRQGHVDICCEIESRDRSDYVPLGTPRTSSRTAGHVASIASVGHSHNVPLGTQITAARPPLPLPRDLSSGGQHSAPREIPNTSATDIRTRAGRWHPCIASSGSPGKPGQLGSTSYGGSPFTLLEDSYKVPRGTPSTSSRASADLCGGISGSHLHGGPRCLRTSASPVRLTITAGPLPSGVSGPVQRV